MHLSFNTRTFSTFETSYGQPRTRQATPTTEHLSWYRPSLSACTQLQTGTNFADNFGTTFARGLWSSPYQVSNLLFDNNKELYIGCEPWMGAPEGAGFLLR